MKYKKNLLLTICIFFASNVQIYGQDFTKQVNEIVAGIQPGTGKAYNRKLFKEIVLCKCITECTKSAGLKLEGDHSLSLLSDFSTGSGYGIKGILYIDSISRLFENTIEARYDSTNHGYYSYTNKITLLDCIEFYNSKLLDDIVKGADKYLPKEKPQGRRNGQ